MCDDFQGQFSIVVDIVNQLSCVHWHLIFLVVLCNFFHKCCNSPRVVVVIKVSSKPIQSVHTKGHTK